jgi:hypothetical protein
MDSGTNLVDQTLEIRLGPAGASEKGCPHRVEPNLTCMRCQLIGVIAIARCKGKDGFVRAADDVQRVTNAGKCRLTPAAKAVQVDDNCFDVVILGRGLKRVDDISEQKLATRWHVTRQRFTRINALSLFNQRTVHVEQQCAAARGTGIGA